MTTLTVLIDEDWPATPLADWVLCGPRGEVMQQGRSEPRHWPAADRRVAVLAGAQVSLCTVTLPNARRQDRERLIAYALEERLPAETDGQHFTLIDQDGERALVAIVEAARLQRVLENCAAIGQALAAVFGRLQCLPRLAGTVVCVDEGAMRYWRWPDGSGFCEDWSPGGEEPVSWLAQKHRQSSTIERVVGPASVAAAVELPVADAAPQSLQWFSTAPATTLLHGPFAPRQAGGSWRQRLRWPLWIAGAALALHLSAGVVSAMVARQAETQLNAQTRAIFEASFPGAAVVDPVLQMRRQLNELRPQHGGLRDDDLLTLLAALADALGSNSRDAIARIAYEAGALQVDLAPALGQKDSQTLIASLAMRGVTAQPPVDGSNGVLTLRRSAP